MPDYSYLVGRHDSNATFWPDPANEEIAYACDWVPLAWLALFEPDDVVSIEEPMDEAGSSAQPRRTCATLIRERAAALATLQRRLARLERLLPADLVRRVRELEAAVVSCRSSHLQVLVTDIDAYVSFDNSARILRELVATMDSDDLGLWRSSLSYVQAQVESTMAEIRFLGAREPAVIGYLAQKSVPPQAGASGNPLFTRNANAGGGWRSMVRPGYLKLLLCLLAAAIIVIASSAN